VYFGVSTVLLVAFFQLWRLIVLVASGDLAGSVPAGVLVQSFLVGMRFDIAIACYIALPITALGLFPFVDIVRNCVTRWTSFTLLIALGAIAFFVHLVDIEFFRFFNSRLNGTALLWSDSPDFALGMIWETYPVIRYLLLYVAVLCLFAILVFLLQRRLIVRGGRSPVPTNTVWLVGLLALFVLGARGRIEEKSPLRWGMAFFSTYEFANQLALNPVFTLVRDIVYDVGSREQVEELLAGIYDPEAETITRRLLGRPNMPTGDQDERIVSRVQFDSTAHDPPSVVLIIMESFGSIRIGALGGGSPYDLSPCFDSLAEQGILFSNIYSTGMHTYTGIVSTLYGYPPGFGKLLMKQAAGRAELWGLPHILNEKDYRTLFFTTHDPHFDNMQGFLMANGFERMYSMFDYGEEEKLSTLGVPDHIMFDNALETLRSYSGERFFATCLTGSNHGPWIIPDAPFDRVPKTDPKHSELDAFKYSDWALGRFVRQLENDSLFENTLVVVTADNGLLDHPVTDIDLSQFRIPLLLYWIGDGGPEPERVDRLGSQLDIEATVMGRLRLDYDNYTFGNDLLDSVANCTPLAHFSEWYKIGYVEEDYLAVARLENRNSLYRFSEPAVDLADSLSETTSEYVRRAQAIYQSAYHNLQRPILRDKRAEQ